MQKTSFKPYSTKEEALKHNQNAVQTNKRYSHFRQTHFTAGDKNQFDEHRIYKQIIGVKNINLETNMFNIMPIPIDITWEKYRNLSSFAIDNTFKYIFNKYKKGVNNHVT